MGQPAGEEMQELSELGRMSGIHGHAWHGFTVLRHRGCLVPWALNRLISAVLFLGAVVSSSPLLSMTRKVVSPSSMVTTCLACGKQTRMRCRATWMLPRLDTFR